MKERKLTILLALLAALALVFAGACSDGSDEAASTENEGNIDNNNNNENNNNNNGGGNNENNNDENVTYCTVCTSETCTVTTGCTGNAQCTACDDCGCTDCGENVVETYTVAGNTYTYDGTSIKDTNHNAPGSEESTKTYLASVELEFANSTSGNTVDITVTYQVCTYNSSNHSSSASWDTAYDTEYTWNSTGAAYSLTGTTLTVTLPDGESDSTVTALTFSVDSNENKLTLTGTTLSQSAGSAIYAVKGNDGTADDSTARDLFDDDVEGALTANSNGSGSSFTLNN